MNHNKLTILLALFLAATSICFSQEEMERAQPKSIISFVPQYLIMNGVRIDYDRRIKEHHWIQLSPQFYLRENSSFRDGDDGYEYYEDNSYYDETDYNNLLGAGMHIYHRYYPRISYEGYTAYLKYGVTWQYFSLKYDEQLFNNYVERYTNINKTGADINFGVVTFLNDFIGIDMYAGLGFRYSHRSSDADNPRKFNDFFESYGYTGNIVNLGLRISFYNF